jgi:hypothetical protein
MDMIEKEMARMNVNEKKAQPVQNINKISSPMPSGAGIGGGIQATGPGARGNPAMMNQKQPDPFGADLDVSMPIDNMAQKIE